MKELKINTIYQGDCLELFKNIKDKSINLICIDPPYNVKKAEWDKIDNYIEWMGKIFIECQRVLKDNGSFYWFHNDMTQIKDLMKWLEDNTEFIYKSFITINKDDNNYIKDLYGSQEHFRNYLNVVEYVLFYTFQDETGLQNIKDNRGLFIPIREYFKKEREKIKHLKIKDINKALGFKLNGGSFASDVLNGYKLNWKFPLKYIYEKFKQLGICNKPYEELRKEYEELRKEYEELRYTFNEKQGEINNWKFKFREDKKVKHPTQKPIKLIEKIIKCSSNEGDLILDCFAGSFTTSLAADNLNRNWICIEKEKTYCEIGLKRVNENRLKLNKPLVKQEEIIDSKND